MTTKRPFRTGASVLAVALLLATAACTGATTGGQAAATGQGTSTSADPAPVAAVTATPALGDTQVARADPSRSP